MLKKKIKLNEFKYINASPYEADEAFIYANYDKDNYHYTLINNYLTYRLLPQKVILSWNFPKEVKVSEALIELSQNRDMSDSLKVVANRYFGKIYNLLTDTKYYWRVTLKTEENGEIVSKVSSFRTLYGRRVLKIEGVENARDFGGIKTLSGLAIKQGLAFRSGEMDNDHQITENGIRELRKVLKIRSDLDLRKPTEINKEGIVPKSSPIGEDVNYFHYSAHEYSAFLKGETNEKEILSVFADFDNYPILYHCKYGADRTGTLTFILHALCGLDENFIALDYELTQWRQRSYEKYRELVESFKKIKGKTFQQKAYFLMKENFGLTLMQISNIYNIFMTDSAVFQSKALTTLHKTEFFLEMRGAKKVKEVLLDGKKTEFSFKENKLKLLTKNKDYKIGKILFNDGQVLWFE